MATRTISDAGGNWGDLTTWVEGVVPGMFDDVVAQGDGTSGNITVNANGSCKSMNFANYTGVFTIDDLKGISVWGGNVTFVPGMTVNDLGVLSLYNNVSLTSAGKTLYVINIGNSSASTFQILDDLNCTSLQFGSTNHTFNTNNHNVNASMWMVAVDSIKVTWNLGTSTIKCKLWNWKNYSTSSLDADQATIELEGAASSFQSAGNQTYGALKISTENEVYISGTSTFGDMKITDGTPATRNVSFSAETQTIIDTFVATGNVTNTVTITGFDMENYGIFTLHKDSGVVSCDYLDLSYSTAEGGAIWNAGSHSINNGNNTGWNFVTVNIKKYCGVTYENIKKASNVTIENVKKIIGVS